MGTKLALLSVGMKATIELDTARRHYRRGAVIFRERETANCAFVIEKGLVEISTDVGDERRVLATMGPGEMFGEMAALDGTERSATATAIEDTELTLIVSDQLRSRVESAEPILKLLLRVILNRFRHEQNLFRHPGNGSYAALKLDPEDDASRPAIDKMKLESDLRSALDRSELRLHYQPIVDLASSKVEGFEALLRWHHRTLGMISPQKFIGLAEETALIVPIGRWVLDRACHDLVRFRKLANRGVSMSVNVSGRQFSEPAFLGELADVMRRTGVDPSALKLEITESVLMDYRSAPLQWIEQCKQLGTQIALDDFGTGFSSLSYLASFPIDTLKIDRSFVAAMQQDPRSLKIVRAINQLAHGIGLNVVAEGIEEPEQHEELARMGCELGQGFLFSRAVCFEEAVELL
jgi:EAL domain-containing protein (putative c-di-GMP-specific phosphodiesterase class I)